MPRIVFVDDNADYLDLLIQELEDEPQEIISLLDQGNKSTYEQIIELKPDILFLDIYLASTTVEELCKQIKDTPEFANVPIYLVSLLSEAEIEDTAASVGATGWLSKPIDTSKFRSILANHFDSESSE